jgi:predicted SAM-dependent methyltransferase
MATTKLHLGSGKFKIPGYVNIDLDPAHKPDIIDDVVTLKKIKEGSVDVMYACMVLEHLGKFKYMEALKRWRKLLKPGGTLRIVVPDFEAVVNYYNKTKDLKTLYSALYAGQTDPYNFHYWCWDFETLKKDLESVGFKNVVRYDRHKTEHAAVRDWSINYVPYHDKSGKELPDEEWFKGTFINLNVEAQK